MSYIQQVLHRYYFLPASGHFPLDAPQWEAWVSLDLNTSQVQTIEFPKLVCGDKGFICHWVIFSLPYLSLPLPIPLFLPVCVCVCVCARVCRRAHLSIHKCRLEVNVGYLPLLFFNLILRQSLSLNLEPTNFFSVADF